jgi:hypothetical protein
MRLRRSTKTARRMVSQRLNPCFVRMASLVRLNADTQEHDDEIGLDTIGTSRGGNVSLKDEKSFNDHRR